MEKRCVRKGEYLSNESVGELNDVHGWFQYSDAQSHVSRAFANNAIHQFIESAKEAEQVKDETGLTPRQLAEQRAELLAAAKLVLSMKRGIDDWLILATHCVELEDVIKKIEARS